LNAFAGAIIFYNKEGVDRALAIPVHGNKPLKMGLLKAVMREAGLTDEDF
jgi:predicted RNA binding protein YcfA (HicA-like mRNA interferase family)